MGPQYKPSQVKSSIALGSLKASQMILIYTPKSKYNEKVYENLLILIVLKENRLSICFNYLKITTL